MKISFPKVYELGLILLVSVWMIVPSLTGLLGILFLCLVIFGALRKELVFEWKGWLLAIFLFFPFYAMYALNSIDSQATMFGLEKKLSFLLFPLIFSFKPTFLLSARRIENAFLAFLLLIISLCYLLSLMNYEDHNFDSAYLFSSHFSGLFHHPTYLSVFCAFGIFLLFKRWEAPRTMREHLLSAGGILFLCYTHIHLESLSGLLFAMLL
ncbi:MAG: hypothetical protein ACKO7O_00585, partial [Bacteroidota bacterium]